MIDRPDRNASRPQRSVSATNWIRIAATLSIIQSCHTGSRAASWSTDSRTSNNCGAQGHLAVQRLKNGVASTHPLRGPELRALRQLRRDWPDGPYLFASERGGPMAASNVRKLAARSGLAAKIPFPVHPHMLRHACGFKLANDGVDTRSLQHYLGHKNITHTVKYTDLAPDRFKGFWKD